MSLPVYSACFYEVSGLTVEYELFVVPDGEVWILRDIDSYSAAGASDSVLYYESTASGGTFSYNQVSTLSHNVVQWRGRQVFAAGGGVTANVISGEWDVRLSGYKLTAA